MLRLTLLLMPLLALLAGCAARVPVSPHAIYPPVPETSLLSERSAFSQVETAVHWPNRSFRLVWEYDPTFLPWVVFIVETTTNLLTWETLGTTTNLSFNITTDTRQRFYRVNALQK